VFFSFFLLLITEFIHTAPSEHEPRLFLLLPFCITGTRPARLCSSTHCCSSNICSTTDHDQPFELSAAPLKAELFQPHTGFVAVQLICEAGIPPKYGFLEAFALTTCKVF
jgi:hypothetical protein